MGQISGLVLREERWSHRFTQNASGVWVRDTSHTSVKSSTGTAITINKFMQAEGQSWVRSAKTGNFYWYTDGALCCACASCNYGNGGKSRFMIHPGRPSGSSPIGNPPPGKGWDALGWFNSPAASGWIINHNWGDIRAL